jgi:hypothetical protein
MAKLIDKKVSLTVELDYEEAVYLREILGFMPWNSPTNSLLDILVGEVGDCSAAPIEWLVEQFPDLRDEWEALKNG